MTITLPKSLRMAASVRRRPGSVLVDAVLVVLIIGLFSGLVQYGQQWFAPNSGTLASLRPMDLSLKFLPLYSFMSFTRGFLAYVVSLIFSVVVGGIAAHSRRAERIIIPVLDVLQGIPVLGFMPGIVITMAGLFPRSNMGLELACILMIFTAQTWNLTFAFYGSLRSVPVEFRDVAKLHRFSWWRTFRSIELPASTIPMVWNSMMSMAGGWFFLMINEAFTLGHRDYRVPGIGSYMSLAVDQGNTGAVAAAMVAMILIIVMTDRLIWNPVTIWSQKFRMDDSTARPRSSGVVAFFSKSLALRKLRRALRPKDRKADHTTATLIAPKQKSRAYEIIEKMMPSLIKTMGTLSLIVLAGLGVLAATKLASLLNQVSLKEWLAVFRGFALTLMRTLACLVLSTIWALPAGIIIGRSPKLAPKLSPIIQILASFPAPMLYPFVVWVLIFFGVNFEIGCTVLMMLGAQWYILFNTIAGAQSIPSDLEEVGQVQQISMARRWTLIYIPAVFPSLLTGLVTAAGGAWNASIIAEFVRFRGTVVTATGLGSLITTSTEAGNIPLLCASVGVMAMALVIINRTIWRRLFQLADHKYSLNR